MSNTRGNGYEQRGSGGASTKATPWPIRGCLSRSVSGVNRLKPDASLYRFGWECTLCVLNRVVGRSFAWPNAPQGMLDSLPSQPMMQV